jgi:hypothetical protein
MQTNSLYVASGIPKLNATPHQQGMPMSQTASLSLTPSTGLFGRLLSIIDRILMVNAEIAHRNGDLTYFGL